MSDEDPALPSRRAFLKGAAGGAGAAVLGTTAARAEGDPLITEVQPWAQGLGEGVDAVLARHEIDEETVRGGPVPPPNERRARPISGAAGKASPVFGATAPCTTRTVSRCDRV